MTFTDDDLNTIKGTLLLHAGVVNSTKIEALLARLEAAEALVAVKEHPVHPFLTSTGDQCEIVKAEQAWRKAAGK